MNLSRKVSVQTDSRIVDVPIGSIKLWADNPRKNDAAVPKLAEIIKARGQITPIVVWRKNNVAYKGNTTLKAMRSLGYPTIKVLYADFPSEQAAIAYGIADNKSSEWAQWDDAILTKFMQAEKMDVASTGFTEGERQFLLAGFDMEKVKKINAEYSTLKDKIVVMIVDHSAREDVLEMLENWIKLSGIKNIEVQK